MSQPRFFALIPAAGVGVRMGAAIPKQYLQVAGKPILRHTVDAFLSTPSIERVFIVISQDDGWADDVFPDANGRLTLLRCGGATRRDSVLNGLEAIARQTDAQDWILVHDAARPGLTPALITRLIDAIADSPVGGLLALPVADTVKRAGDGTVATISREGLWLAQTPQAFRHELLMKALRENAMVTDEASAIEALGLCPMLVEGHVSNTKVTTPSDLALVEMFLAAEMDGDSGKRKTI